MHTNILSALMKAVNERNLNLHFEREQRCINRERQDKALSLFLQDTKGTPQDKLRVYLVHVLCDALSVLKEVTVKVPFMEESINKGDVKSWLKKEGDYVSEDTCVVTIETDKLEKEVRAPESGVITKVLVEEGETVAVGKELCLIDTEGKAPENLECSEEKKIDEHSKSTASSKHDSKKTEEDSKVDNKEQPKSESSRKIAPRSSPTPSKDDPEKSYFTTRKGETRIKMTRMRARIAERLKESQNTCASLTTLNEIDMRFDIIVRLISGRAHVHCGRSKIVDIRKRYKELFREQHGINLGFMSAFLAASVAALKEQPVVNAVIEGADIVYRDYIDISVAVATPKGLVVPVIRGVNEYKLVDFERELAKLAEKARNGKLAMEDIVGGTFTVSNGGVFGSLMGTPIINLPQSAILGMHSIKERPMAVDGKVEIRPMMYVALTYDHRLIDGREAVTFLRKIKEIVEDPVRLLLGI
ncbi:hypothetical protein Zmor_004111 [Zophobas morio]|uniref:Dihydrolipoyllysine-residue succinyltransferase component of 2-oxoglutarate dehydrogenase complex, mitochondrial n=1 Tax=Zophobas morio TaxID=2755281 RepID=A0AA38HKI1_9CUCU|nr:hypothetical protein Zmor_004111 [Zophobas morio]